MKDGRLYGVITGGEDLQDVICHRQAKIADGLGKSGERVWEQEPESHAHQGDRHADCVTVIILYLVWEVHQDSFHVGKLLPVYIA